MVVLGARKSILRIFRNRIFLLSARGHQISVFNGDQILPHFIGRKSKAVIIYDRSRDLHSIKPQAIIIKSNANNSVEMDGHRFSVY